MSNTGKFNQTTNRGTGVCSQCGKRRQMANLDRRANLVCLDCDYINGLEIEHLDLQHEPGSEPQCPDCQRVGAVAEAR